MSVTVIEARPWPGKPRRFRVETVTDYFDLHVGQTLLLEDLHKLRSDGVVVVIR